MTKFVNYNVGDGTYCIGCKNKTQITHQWCKLKHDIKFLNGCDKCASISQRTEVLHGFMNKCHDYVPDPNFFEKDPYG